MLDYLPSPVVQNKHQYDILLIFYKFYKSEITSWSFSDNSFSSLEKNDLFDQSATDCFEMLIKVYQIFTMSRSTNVKIDIYEMLSGTF